jgi:hypothetical protein
MIDLGDVIEAFIVSLKNGDTLDTHLVMSIHDDITVTNAITFTNMFRIIENGIHERGEEDEI